MLHDYTSHSRQTLSEIGGIMSDKLDRPYYAVLQGGYPAEQKHHIFPGNGRRDLCEKYNLWVPISAVLHDLAHGRYNVDTVDLIQPLFDFDLTRANIQIVLAARFCKKIDASYAEARWALNNYNDSINGIDAKHILERISGKAALAINGMKS